MTTTSTTRWRLVGGASAGLVGALIFLAWLGGNRSVEVALGHFTLVESAAAAGAPAVSQEVAGAAAQDRLATLNPDVRGLSLSGAHFAAKLGSISKVGGDLVYKSDPAADSWVFEFDGPPQNGFQKVEALVVVDAQTGTVVSAQILQSN